MRVLGFNEDLPAPRPATLASSSPSKPGRPLSKNMKQHIRLFPHKARLMEGEMLIFQKDNCNEYSLRFLCLTRMFQDLTHTSVQILPNPHQNPVQKRRLRPVKNGPVKAFSFRTILFGAYQGKSFIVLQWLPIDMPDMSTQVSAQTGASYLATSLALP